MKGGFVSYLAWWGAYAVGIISIVYSVMLRMRENGEDQESEESPGIVIPSAVILALLVAGMVLTGIFAKVRVTSWTLGEVFLAGGVLAIASAYYSRWKSESTNAAASDAFFGVGLALFAMAFLKNCFRDAPMLYVLVFAMGAWFAAAVFYYGRPGKGLAGARFGDHAPSSWAAVRAFSFTAIILAASIAMAVFRYPRDGSGALFVVDACALGLLMVIACLIVFRNTTGWRMTIGSALLIVFTGLLDILLGNALLDEVTPGLCVLAGLVVSLALYWLNGVSQERAISANEAGALSALMAIGCAALAMRWLGAYGVTLAGVGALVSSLYVLAAGWEHQSGNAPLFSSTALAAGLSALGLARVFAENTGGTALQVHLFESYSMTGLVLGGVLIMAFTALPESWSGEMRWGGIGRGLGAVALSLGIVLAAVCFWRNEATVGLVLGLASGMFFLMIAARFFGKTAGAPDIVLGLALFSATALPSFLTATMDLTRGEKIIIMICVLFVAAVLLVASSVVRVRREGNVGG